MITLKKLQNEVQLWSYANFGIHPNWHPLLGVVEEVGELSHAVLKQEQGIRGTYEEHQLEIRDSVGDLVIFLADFCASREISLEECVEETWAKVKKRDWQKVPKDGRVTNMD